MNGQRIDFVPYDLYLLALLSGKNQENKKRFCLSAATFYYFSCAPSPIYPLSP
jgi:hypothetical protein